MLPDQGWPDEFRAHLERNIEWDKRRLAELARSIIRDLDAIAKRMEHGDDPIINELGELQGRATMFDAHCARYAADRQALKDFDGFRGALDDNQAQEDNDD